MNANFKYCCKLLPMLSLFSWSCVSNKIDEANVQAELPGQSASDRMHARKGLEVARASIIGVKTSGFDLSASMPYGPGSGLRLVSQDQDQVLLMYTTDRGPNSDLPSSQNQPKRAAKSFPQPSFAPSFGLIALDLKTQQAKVQSAVSLVTPTGQRMTGLPLPQGSLGATNELAFDSRHEIIAGDANGMDPEAVDLDGKGTVYLSEEYRPSILQVDQTTGRVREVWEPGRGLPDIFKFRTPNRGFEALTLTKNGNLVALLQSTLTLPENLQFPGVESARRASFIRGLRKEIGTGKVTQFAYPISAEFKSHADAKIGDMIALSENLFLVINQGKTKGDKQKAFIELLDTDGACDLSEKKLPDGSELEFASSIEEVSKICNPARVEQILDLGNLGWHREKTEGLALLNDRTLVLINDNDFGLGMDGQQAKTELLVVEFKHPIFDLLKSP